MSIKEEIKENIKSFTVPAKQAVKNISGDIKRAPRNITMDIRENKGKGCIKYVIYFILAVILMTCISKCSDTDNKTHENAANQSPKTEMQSDNGKNNEIQENKAAENNDEQPAASDSAADNDYGNISNSSSGMYMQPQISYAKKNNIKLNSFSKEQAALDKFIDNDNCKEVNVENAGVLKTEYKITNSDSRYIYHGELKDNRPNGYGVLMNRSEYDCGLINDGQRYYDIMYIGSFKDGAYEGYGIEFNIPDNSEEYEVFKSICQYDKNSDEYLAYYLGWINYASYNGYFKNGKRDGKGNSYKTYIGPFADTTSINGTTYEEELKNIRYPLIDVGEFKDGTLNGKADVYEMGILQYSGEMKNDKKNGKGKTFFANGAVEYDGEFKNDMRHGKGKLYDENGGLEYDGEWKNDDYK